MRRNPLIRIGSLANQSLMASQPKILIVDDDRLYAKLLAANTLFIVRVETQSVLGTVYCGQPGSLCSADYFEENNISQKYGNFRFESCKRNHLSAGTNDNILKSHSMLNFRFQM